MAEFSLKKLEKVLVEQEKMLVWQFKARQGERACCAAFREKAIPKEWHDHIHAIEDAYVEEGGKVDRYIGMLGAIYEAVKPEESLSTTCSAIAEMIEMDPEILEDGDLE